MILLGIVTASYFLLPFLLTTYARSLIRVDELAPADIIISLSGDAYCLRERTAASLYQQGLARFVVVSGYAYGPDLDTSIPSQNYLLSLGLPASAVMMMPGGGATRCWRGMACISIYRPRGGISVQLPIWPATFPPPRISCNNSPALRWVSWPLRLRPRWMRSDWSVSPCR